MDAVTQRAQAEDGAGLDAEDGPVPGEPAPAGLNGSERAASLSLVIAVLVGAALWAAARGGALALLVAVAVIQAVLAFAWVYAADMPGRKGAIVLGGFAAITADVCVSVWPHGRLGALLGALGLTIPALIVHQLMRGTARSRVTESLAGIAVLVLAEVGLAALVQLRHSFDDPDLGGAVAAGAAVIITAALAVGRLVDMIIAAPRFDPAVERGLLGVVAATGLGGSLGYLLLQSQGYASFAGGRGAFIGAALGAVSAFCAVGAAFIDHAQGPPSGSVARWLRPLRAVLFPLAVVAPLAYLICVAVRL